MATKTYYSVSEINNFIKDIFDNLPLLRNITLKGEISNCRGKNKSGHLYFSLKDSKCSISAVMFKYDTLSLEFSPKDGDEVIVTGSISSYPPSGTYQIICRSIMLAGKGEQLLKKELLKAKLFKEGIFDDSHKKELPLYPENIAIITGKNSAAAKDFEFNINRRFPIAKIKIFYSLVQGDEAAQDLIKNLNSAINSNPDLIIIGRGGGSIEDLSAFDDENLVRAIYDSSIPIISAVGHEINLSLCDLVADKHASTPTGAAEIAVPDTNDVIDDINHYSSYINSLIKGKISDLNAKLLTLANNKKLKNVNSIFDSYNSNLDKYLLRATNGINKKLDSLTYKLNHLENSLDLLDPNSLLKKGYSMIFDNQGKVINSIQKLKSEDILIAKMSDGEVTSIIKEIKKNG